MRVPGANDEEGWLGILSSASAFAVPLGPHSLGKLHREEIQACLSHKPLL